MNMARKQENPGDLFKYLETNKIGQEVAIYYSERATWKETAGFIREAKEIYQLGIKRNAQPLEKLKKQYEKFKLRTANMRQEPEVKSESILTDQAAPAPPAQNEKVRVFQDDTVESLVKTY
jgi:Mad3/BUB1 homology region 1